MTVDVALIPRRTPHFYLDGEAEMFVFVIDERNIVGPRPATGRDRFEHAAAYRLFRSGVMGALSLGEHALEIPEPFNGADPAAFDHDGDGKPGGAPKGGNRKKKPAKAAAA